MLRTFASGTIEWFIDQNRHVVLSRWEGDIRGDELLAVSPVLWREHPEVGRYGAVHDLLDFTGVIEHRYGRELMRLRAEFFGHDLPPVRTAIVSADLMRNFELKVATIEAPERQFRLFASNRAGLDWVMANEPGNLSAIPDDQSAALPWWFDRAVVANRAG
jgi:hypothetical protein